MLASTFSETLAESVLVKFEFNRRASAYCYSLHDRVLNCRTLIVESRELIAKVDKVLERDKHRVGN